MLYLWNWHSGKCDLILWYAIHNSQPIEAADIQRGTVHVEISAPTIDP